MGEQKNLTEDNVSELRERLEKMKEENPDLEYRFFRQDQEQPDSVDTITLVKELTTKVDNLNTKIDRIFGNHILMDGLFTDIKI